jgi:hypothetical protein
LFVFVRRVARPAKAMRLAIVFSHGPRLFRGLATGAIAGLPSGARISATDHTARRSLMVGVVLAGGMPHLIDPRNR